MERLNFDISERGPWRVSTVNKDGFFCLTYPQNLLVPAIITDEDLKAASSFRAAHRLPTVVWRYCFLTIIKLLQYTIQLAIKLLTITLVLEVIL